MGRKLEQILLRSNLIDPAELAKAAVDAVREQARLAWVLIETGAIEEHELAQVVAQSTKTALVDPLPSGIPTWVYRRIPGPIARQYKVIPIEVNDQELRVAMVDPTDSDALDVIAAVTSLTVASVVGLKSSIERMLNEIYPVDVDVDATLLSPQNVADDSGDISGDISDALEHAVVAEPGLDTMIVSPSRSKSRRSPPTDKISLIQRLERLENEVSEISKLLGQVQQALAELRNEVSTNKASHSRT